MDRTRRLLMGVTASALLTAGGGKTNPGLAKATALTMNSETVEPNLAATVTEAYRYYQPQTDESRKIAAAAAVITKLLSGVPEQSAMTLNELLARKPELDRGIAEKALAGLVKSEQIRRTGDGTQFKPFRYYDRSRGGTGG